MATQTGFTVIPLQICFILIIKALLILRSTFQLNKPSRSGENGNLDCFVVFSNGGHPEFSNRLNFIILKAWSLIMLRMKFKIHGCSG